MSFGFLATIFAQSGFGRRSFLTSDLLFKAVFPICVIDTGNICMALWSPQTRLSALGLKGSLSLHACGFLMCTQAHWLGNFSLHDYSRCCRCLTTSFLFHSWSCSEFDLNEIRLIVYQDCERRGRQVLFDSKAVHKTEEVATQV